MYIDLLSKEIWVVDGLDRPDLFLTNLLNLIDPTSVLVVGSYDAGPEAEAWLEAHSSPVFDKQYGDSFALNRAQYPRGKSWEIVLTESNVQDLIILSKLNSGSKDKNLFFDHLLAFRRFNNETVPLFEFHDAFSGGSLRISDKIEDQKVLDFCLSLGMTPSKTYTS
jgi:hypothetical protein